MFLYFSNQLFVVCPYTIHHQDNLRLFMNYSISELYLSTPSTANHMTYFMIGAFNIA